MGQHTQFNKAGHRNTSSLLSHLSLSLSLSLSHTHTHTLSLSVSLSSLSLSLSLSKMVWAQALAVFCPAALDVEALKTDDW